tara:strand:+ start:2833 stop:3150 length:318 start_codon:yes stop_codon:yes gene_type:complete
MFKIILSISLLFFLNNCASPGSAFLGPTFTGIKTGSVYQTSMSFGSNQIVQKIKESTKKTKDKVNKITKKIEDMDLEINSKDFYASIKNFYLKEKQKKEISLFHR